MFSRGINTLIVSLAVSTFACAAQAAPQQAFNKSIQVTFNFFTPGKGTNGATVRVTRNVSEHFYISSQGRVFSKMATGTPSHKDQKLNAPGQGNFKFVGDKIVGTIMHVSGATQQTISFDSSFQSCSSTVVVGQESGKPFSWKGLDGVVYTAIGKPEISNVTCSISQGNTLAN